ncbi:MAG TPA: NAD(P)-dependent oxidoreductase [Dehalococcoidia bacterium]|nr:NAD(P)-dependent oxidoreductase [Dehalococcoidia bacterium]
MQGIEYFCDIENEDLETVLRRYSCEVVIHTAANYGREDENAMMVFDANLRLGLRILESAANAGCRLFVNTGSQLPKFINAYGLSKAQLGEWGRLLSSRIQFVDLKIEQMYGPKDDERKFVTWLLHQFKSRVPEVFLSPGTQERDFVHVTDVVSAIAAVIDKSGLLPPYARVDVGSGNLCEVREFVCKARDIWQGLTGEKLDVQLIFGALQYRQGEKMKVLENLEPLYNLGWHPKVSLDDGLKNLIEAYIVGDE